MNVSEEPIKPVLQDLRYLELLSRSFPTVSSVTTEIINLEAILNLPKGTEHFLADVHGEYEAFQHVIRNASGNIKRKVNEIFANSLREQEKKELCTLIYYPEEKLSLVKSTDPNLTDYYHTTLNLLVEVCRVVSSKYTRSKVRKALPAEYAYIIEELLHEANADKNKQGYFNVIVDTIISTGRADSFITAICHLIQGLAIDHLHILGDVYDRGSGPHLIMEMLRRLRDWDLTWGNHDIVWMGAAVGNLVCMADVIRIALRYGNTTTLEEGYGINMVPLATFALETYGDDPCELFQPRFLKSETVPSEKTVSLIAKMHKAISVIRFKLEQQLVDRHPEWKMQDRNILSTVNLKKGTCVVEGKTYPMLDTLLPTVDPKNPSALTLEEQELVEALARSFTACGRLRKHMMCQLKHGAMYNVVNGNLLFHASVPLNADGTLKEIEVEGEKVKGRALMDRIEQIIATAFDTDSQHEERSASIDYFWYLWSGADSPLFDKSKMATFERYFIADKATHHEEKGAYYTLRNEAKICNMLLDEFGVQGKHRHIINGHVPVKVGKGEKPVKADGLLMVIDGGFAKAYHSTTGIAGYTLVYHSRGFQLVQHEPFTSTEEAIRTGADIRSTTQLVEMSGKRLLVDDTDKGHELRIQIEDLKKLLLAYRRGIIKENDR
ncbi:MAG: fructose-1,6-bisphosphatase [Bacteroidales bacterium]|nr:fructose-1,6-bisphosphatase [Bacteroidales bacterium]